MGPVCPQRTMAVLQVQYSDILYYSHNKGSEKHITFTLYTNLQEHKWGRWAGMHALTQTLTRTITRAV